MPKTIVTTETTYEILRPLGSGGMGQVLLVQGPRQADPVALKLLQSQWMTDTRIEGFKREFALLSELHHPHLCQAYDFGFSTSHQQYFFTSEYVDGEQLYRALDHSRIQDVETVIVQILSALDFLHAAGLVHFDVKGENVLVQRTDGRLTAKLVDLGVTSPTNRKLTEVAGTLHYIAPELLLPDPQPDGRCDLYSFGVMCYYVLAGQLPYAFQKFDDVWEWHRSHSHPDWEPLCARGVPEYLCQMIERLMRPTPSERFSRAGVVIDFLAVHSPVAQQGIHLLERTRTTEGPFVGRSTLMASIAHVLKSAATPGRGKTVRDKGHRTIVVVGREGMGKTRTLQELKFAAQLTEYSVRSLDGQAHGTAWESLRQGWKLSAKTTTAETAANELLAAARHRPLCCCIDNLHAAAPMVQQQVYAIMGLLYSASLIQETPPLVLIATLTPDQRPANMLGAMPLELAALAREDVEHYLHQVIGTPEDFGTFAERVWAFSAGIPLLMVEAARAYHQETTLPASIEDLYRRQIARCSPAAQQLLQFLGFANRPIPFSLIATAIEGSVESALVELRKEHLLRHIEADDTYALSTGAVAAVAQASIPEATQRRFAAILLTWLEGLPATAPRDLVPYLLHCDDAAMVCRRLTEAGRAAETGGAAVQAIQIYQCLAERQGLMGTVDAALATRRKIATLQLYQGQFDACEQTLQAMVQGQRQVGIDELKLFGLLCRVRRKPRDAIRYYEEALQQVPADSTDPRYLALRNERAQALLEAGSIDEAIPIFTETARDATALPPAQQSLVTNNNLGAALARVGRYDEAIAFYEAKRRGFPNDPRMQGSIATQLATIQMQAGKIHEAIRSFETAWAIANQISDLFNGRIILENLIALLQKTASYSKALEYAKKAIALKSVGTSEPDMGRGLMTLATLYLNLGLLEVGARHLTQAMRIARRSRDHQLRGWIEINFGYLNKFSGQLMEALNAFEETIFIGEEHTDEELIRWGRYGAADVLVDQGSLEEATQLVGTIATDIAQVPDPEFQARFALLQHRITVLKEARPTDAAAEALAALSARCADAGWLELQWEVEHLLGILFQKREELPTAKAHLERAAETIRALAANLGEEFRDGFLKQRMRARVFTELKSVARDQVYVSGFTASDSGGEGPGSPKTTALPSHICPIEKTVATRRGKG